MSGRLKLSNDDRERLEHWASSNPPSPSAAKADFAKQLYRGFPSGIADAMRLELARLRDAGITDDGALADAAAMAELLEYSLEWQRPEFPLKGRDLIDQGMKPGRNVGKRLKLLEELWVDGGFELGMADLLRKK